MRAVSRAPLFDDASTADEPRAALLPCSLRTFDTGSPGFRPFAVTHCWPVSTAPRTRESWPQGLSPRAGEKVITAPSDAQVTRQLPYVALVAPVP